MLGHNPHSRVPCGATVSHPWSTGIRNESDTRPYTPQTVETILIRSGAESCQSVLLCWAPAAVLVLQSRASYLGSTDCVLVVISRISAHHVERPASTHRVRLTVSPGVRPTVVASASCQPQSLPSSCRPVLHHHGIALDRQQPVQWPLIQLQAGSANMPVKSAQTQVPHTSP